MKRLALILFAFAAAVPAFAQTPYGACTAAARSLGVCRVGSVAWFAFDAPDSTVVADLQAFAVSAGGYQAVVPCAAERSYSRGILDVAGVAEGDCTAPQIGEDVANPQTVNEFTYVYIRNILRAALRDWKQSQAAASVPVEPEPDFGDGEAP
jgi:hypothetical protein